MKRFALVVTAAVAACTFATPTLAGNNQNNQQGYYYSWTPRDQHNVGNQGNNQAATYYGMSEREYRALQARKECQMYAFQSWRYHPDYAHCGYN